MTRCELQELYVEAENIINIRTKLKKNMSIYNQIDLSRFKNSPGMSIKNGNE